MEILLWGCCAGDVEESHHFGIVPLVEITSHGFWTRADVGLVVGYVLAMHEATGSNPGWGALDGSSFSPKAVDARERSGEGVGKRFAPARHEPVWLRRGVRENACKPGEVPRSYVAAAAKAAATRNKICVAAAREAAATPRPTPVN